MLERFLLVAAFVLAHIGTLCAQLFPDLYGPELLEKLVTEYKPAFVLDYDDARDTLYARIYNWHDSVACVYTGHRLHLPPGEEPSTWLFMGGTANGINCEHTFPQSKGAEFGNPKSDMHHLFPTRSAVNESRSNDPFADIPDEQTQKWFFENQAMTSIPDNGIDAYSEKAGNQFEPREDHKGNVARAMFYFYTMYQPEADAADPNFFSIQRETLCHWHYQDPADSLELARTWQIAAYQDEKPNPYVLDCTLTSRTFCGDIPADCPPPLVSSTQNDPVAAVRDLPVFPNPVQDAFFIELPAMVDCRLTLVDALGQILLVQERHQPGTAIELAGLPAGAYLVFVENGREKWVGKVFKK